MNNVAGGLTINRIAVWVAIIPLGLYVLNMGQWVGAAEEKFEDAEAVEEQVDDLKDRLIALERDVKNHDESVALRALALLTAIEQLEAKIDDME